MNPDTEIRKLNPSNLRELVNILENADSWKRLMELIPKRLDKENYECDYNDANPPKYNSEHFRLIEFASGKYKRLCSEILLDEWGTSGRVRPTLGHLLHLLKKAQLFRAADFIAIDLLKIDKPKRPKEGPAAHVKFLLESDKDDESTNISIPNTIDNNIERNIPAPKKQVNLPNPISEEVSDMMKFSRSNEDNGESIPENIPKISALLTDSKNTKTDSEMLPNIGDLLLDEVNSRNMKSDSGNVPNLSALMHNNSFYTPQFSELLDGNKSENDNCLPQLSQLLLASALLHSKNETTLPLLSAFLQESQNAEMSFQLNNKRFAHLQSEKIIESKDENESRNENSEIKSMNASLSTQSKDFNNLPLISDLLPSASKQINENNSQTNTSTLLHEISALLKSISNKQTSDEATNETTSETKSDLLISKRVKEILMSKRLPQYSLAPQLSLSANFSELLDEEIRKLLCKVDSELKTNEEEIFNSTEETNSLGAIKKPSLVLNNMLGKIEEIVKEETESCSLPLISELLKSELQMNKNTQENNASELTPAISELLNSEVVPQISNCLEVVPQISNLLESDRKIDDKNACKLEVRLSAIRGNNGEIKVNGTDENLTHNMSHDGIEGEQLKSLNESVTPGFSDLLLNTKEITPDFSDLLNTPKINESKEFTSETSVSLKRNGTASEIIGSIKSTKASLNNGLNQASSNQNSLLEKNSNKINGEQTLRENDESQNLNSLPQIHISSSAETKNTSQTPKMSCLLPPNAHTESNTSNEMPSLNSNSSNRPQCNSPLPNLSLNTILPHFNYFELESATDNFDETPHPKGRFLGSGAFGSVYLCLGLMERPTAVKKLHLDGATEVNVNDTITKQFRNEVELLCSYKHDNLLSICGYSCDGPTYCIMYEYISGGALNYRLENKKEDLNWRDRLRIACGTAEAVAYLHTAYSRQLIHRDIKTANILLDSANKPKLGDFGIIKLSANKNTTVATTIIGTSVYMAPESFRSGEVTVKTDTFSFGVVILELLTALPPLDENRDDLDLITYVGNMCDNDTIMPLLDLTAGSWMKGETNVAEELFKIANRCLADKKHHRPNMVEVSDFLNKLSSC